MIFLNVNKKRLFLLKSNRCFCKNRYISISFESKNESMRKAVKRAYFKKKKGHIFPEKGHFNVNPPLYGARFWTFQTRIIFNKFGAPYCVR